MFLVWFGLWIEELITFGIVRCAARRVVGINLISVCSCLVKCKLKDEGTCQIYRQTGAESEISRTEAPASDWVEVTS
jgi:hypothetical protein